MQSKEGGDVIRASPSPLASRPQPRMGLVSCLFDLCLHIVSLSYNPSSLSISTQSVQCWTVSNNRLWEFGGQKLLRTAEGNVRYANKVTLIVKL